MHFKLAGWQLEQRHMCELTPTRMRSNAVGGGGGVLAWLGMLQLWVSTTYTQHSCKQVHVHKITNVPVFYMKLILNGFWGRQINYSGHWKGWALEISTFLGPNVTHFAKPFQGPKRFDLQGPPLPMSLIMDLARLKPISYRANRYIKS